jgi:hypothetical protein
LLTLDGTLIAKQIRRVVSPKIAPGISPTGQIGKLAWQF